MKRAASILAVVVPTILIGCHDNSITDPISAPASEHLLLSKARPATTLDLNAVLREPGNVVNSFIEVTGQVVYTATLVPLDPIPPNPQDAMRLNMTVDALLMPVNSNGPVWSISGSSEDWAAIPESGTTFLTKRYQIEGRNDGMHLNLRFRITPVSVELGSMWLELPRVLRAADLD